LEVGGELLLRQHFLRLVLLESQRVPPFLDELLPLFQLAIVLPLVDEAGLLVLIVLFFRQYHQRLGYLIHVQLVGPHQFQEDVLRLSAVVLIVEQHGRFEAEGIESPAEGEVALQEGFADEIAVE
jgi:hypothetical protein